jgi:hypothetical protein
VPSRLTLRYVPGRVPFHQQVVEIEIRTGRSTMPRLDIPESKTGVSKFRRRIPCPGDAATAGRYASQHKSIALGLFLVFERWNSSPAVIGSGLVAAPSPAA